MGILVDSLKGLDHAHSHHILHRDIKPENIFINDKGRAMIGDFGVARKISRSTMARTYIGTPLYMAPEVIQNPLGEAYDWTADIYSLGLVAYEMLTGKLPFEEECKGDENCIVARRLNRDKTDSGFRRAGCPHSMQKLPVSCEPQFRQVSTEPSVLSEPLAITKNSIPPSREDRVYR